MSAIPGRSDETPEQELCCYLRFLPSPEFKYLGGVVERKRESKNRLVFRIKRRSFSAVAECIYDKRYDPCFRMRLPGGKIRPITRSEIKRIRRELCFSPEFQEHEREVLLPRMMRQAKKKYGKHAHIIV